VRKMRTLRGVSPHPEVPVDRRIRPILGPGDKAVFHRVVPSIADMRQNRLRREYGAPGTAAVIPVSPWSDLSVIPAKAGISRPATPGFPPSRE
jgi:hypothetical protein